MSIVSVVSVLAIVLIVVVVVTVVVMVVVSFFVDVGGRSTKASLIWRYWRCSGRIGIQVL